MLNEIGVYETAFTIQYQSNIGLNVYLCQYLFISLLAIYL